MRHAGRQSLPLKDYRTERPTELNTHKQPVAEPQEPQRLGTTDNKEREAQSDRTTDSPGRTYVLLCTRTHALTRTLLSFPGCQELFQLKCRVCNTHCPRSNDLRTHVKRQHDLFYCDLCWKDSTRFYSEQVRIFKKRGATLSPFPRTFFLPVAWS